MIVMIMIYDKILLFKLITPRNLVDCRQEVDFELETAILWV